MDEKIMIGDGRIDTYLNGMNSPDGYLHDHIWEHVRQDGSVSQAGVVLRDHAREGLARELGRTALDGFIG